MKKYDFGSSNNELNYALVKKLAGESLHERVGELGEEFDVGEFGEFDMMFSSKGYQAKSETSITMYEGQNVGSGKLVSVLFFPGNGTGNRETYGKIGNLPGRWTPRSKEGQGEVMFSLGTGIGKGEDGRWIPGLTSLEEYIMVGRQAFKRNEFNPSKGCLREVVKNEREYETSSLVRSDFTYIGEQFGNPHAIAFVPDESLWKSPNDGVFFQVAAFLAFPDSNHSFDAVKRAVERNRPK